MTNPKLPDDHKWSNWDQLELCHLKYAIAVSEKQGFTNAAAYLEIDQGFLSKQIKWLEKKIGFQLFDRNQRPLKLTNAGNEFLQEAGIILHQLEQAIELGQRLSRGEKGRLNIGINTSIANSKLPDILRGFHEKFPEVELMLQELASYDQIDKLRNQKLDLGFFHLHNLRNINNDNVLTFIPVLQESLVIVLPENHRFARRTSISLAALANEQFILPPNNLLYNFREQINDLCMDAGFKPKVKQEAAWISTVLSLVAGGMGISLLPANVQNLQRHGVIYRSIQGQLPVLEIVAVWRSDNVSIILKNFLEVISNLS
ncbi:LysR family transcriptional regulator [Dolichospermum circinale]|uniref:LysR family transcriptional regulator n=1 Tax=Dolichospermum circinale TaxID=109265 RepID=UPI000414D87E|nr:LysR family transcriptional regulator [Dolichospermum circinale]MDB9458773.1 LysR substrate-binding domain-containing protein [Dolichospermum circinale CS-545/17]MDB9468261.1 LysR substrate-binding domain-containing protein [Dolichospermum circinale CS-539/09]MDB9470102.1 LysR substrate-binding domain-containing protein [Dolichospermum circinale CS-539]